MDSLECGMRPARAAARVTRAPTRSRSRSRCWARRRSPACRGAALRAAVARAAAGSSSGLRGAGRGAAGERRLERHGGLHLALRAVGVSDGDEVITSPFSFVASANVIVYERARPVFVDIDPLTLTIDPAAAAAAVTAHGGAAAGAHLRLAGRRAGARARSACRSSRMPARRSARGHADGVAVGAPRAPGGVRVLRQQAADDRRGRHGDARRRGVKVRIDCERNQGRAPDMGWLDHDRLGFNYRLSDIACAIGLVQLDRLEGMLAARAGVARPTARRWPASRGSSCRARTRRRVPRLVRLRRVRCRAGRSRRDDPALRDAACRASPTCPRST